MIDRRFTHGKHRMAHRNPPLICVFHALQMSLFPMAIVTIFWQRQVGMTMTEIMALQAGFGLAMALFEFPSGFLADRIGYRRTLLAASLVTACAWGLYVGAGSFWRIALAEALLGVGLSLVSGTDSALLYESLVESGEERQFSRWSGRMVFWGQSAEGLAALSAGLLYTLSPRLPFQLEVGVWVANLGVALALVEPIRSRPSLGQSADQIKRMLRFAVLESPRLRRLIGAIVVFGLSSFIPVWMIQIYAVEAGMGESWLGPMWAVANFIVALTALASHRLERRLGLSTSLSICGLLVGIGYFGLAAVHHLWGFVFYFCLTAARGLSSPILQHEEHRAVASANRAGFLSLRSLVFRLSFLVLGPLVGAAVDRSGQRPVLGALGMLLCLAIAAAVLALRRPAQEGRRGR